MFEPLSVTALGSCRIVNPMRLAAQAGDIRLNNTDVYGYLHTAREVLQFLDFRVGQEMPADLTPYLSGLRASQTRSEHVEPRVYLVEISSLKTVLFGDWVLQLNYFIERFRVQTEILKIIHDNFAEHERDRRTMELLRLPAFRELKAFDRHVLVNTHVKTVTREDLEREVLEIASRLPRPVVFVTHCNIPAPDGLQIESRARISAWMAELGRLHGLTVFDPTPHILSFGVEAAMAQDGASRAHYGPDFEQALKEELLRAIRLAAASPYANSAHADIARPIPTQRAPPLGAVIGSGAAQLCVMATQLVNSGELDAASTLARASAAADPSGAAAVALIAQIALRKGNAELALEIALQARSTSPRNTSLLATAAKALTKLKRFEDAAVLWQEMATHRPNSTVPLIEAARCRLRAKQFDKSLDLAAEVLRRDPQEAVALAVKAEALRLLGRMDELSAVAEALAESTPEAALAIMQWMIAAGQVYGLASVARKVTAASSGVSQAHRDEVSHQLKAAIQHALTQQFWENAAETLRAYLVFHPEDPDAVKSLTGLATYWLKLARTAALAGDFGTAADAYENALRIDPEGGRILREAASTAEKRSEWKRAADLWNEVVRAEPTNGSVLMRAARAALLADQPDRALQIYRKAVEVDPENPKARASVASLTRRLSKHARRLEEAGDIKAAVRCAGVVLASDPDEAICTRLLRRSGAFFASQLRQAVADGDTSRQEDLAIQLLQIDPKRFEALRVLSKARLSSGRFDEAEPLLRRLTVEQSNVAAHWVKLGRCLRLMKNYDAARDAAREALARDPGSLAAHKILSDLHEHRVT